MTEIIVRGLTHHEASCSKCRTKFRYKTDEIKHNYVVGGEGVHCPYCGEWHRHVIWFRRE